MEDGMLHDERGKKSLGRALLIAWSVNAFVAIGYELFSSTHYQLSNAAWAVISSVEVALIAWNAGPRIAQYLGPQIGAVAKGVGEALRSARLPSRLDDERGDIKPPEKKP